MSTENSGAVVIIYKIKDGQFEYLLPTQENGTTNFIGGRKESDDRTYESAIRREISEETNLEGGDYSIRQTDIVHKFIYSNVKEGKEGKDWMNKVFIAEVNSDKEMIPSDKVETLKWYNEEDAIKSLCFKDMKQVFVEATEMIKRKHE